MFSSGRPTIVYPWRMARRRLFPTTTFRILQRRPLSLQLYNSRTQCVAPFPVAHTREEDGHRTGIPNIRAVYTCGPTVYAPAHLGHARTYIWLDILRRCVDRYHSPDEKKQSLVYVLNITDVDDKILQEAERTAIPPLELARRYEREFWRDWDRLQCRRPHVVTRVSEYVESDILPYIQRLLDRGFAYIIRSDSNDDQDGIYFDIQALERQTGIPYGVFAPPPPPEETDLRPDHETRSATSPKRDPRDFALWKCKAESNTTPLGWSSPWGPGRPGWHIECSAMIEAVSRQLGGAPFVLHCGGVDLQFPHHTNEVAQAQAFHWDESEQPPGSGHRQAVEEWIPHWVHTGHLHIEGRKMSKSLKNFISIQEFLSSSPGAPEESDHRLEHAAASSYSELSRADDLRLWVLGLSGSYRGTATFSEERLVEARNVRSKLVRCLLEGEEWMRQPGRRAESTVRWSPQDTMYFTTIQDAVAQCHAALCSDLDGSTCVAQMVRIAEESRSYWNDKTNGPTEPSRYALQALRDLLSLVGLSDVTCRAGQITAMDTADPMQLRWVVEELAQFRSAIRKAAIDEHKHRASPPTENMKQILRLCDEYRDTVFPSLGVELLDGKVDTISAEEGSSRPWRFCVPKGTYRPTKPLLSEDSSSIFIWTPVGKPSKQRNTPPLKNIPPATNPPVSLAAAIAIVPPPPPLATEDSDDEEEWDVDSFPEFASADGQKKKKKKHQEISPLRRALKASPIRDEPPATYFQTGLYTGLFSQFDVEGFPLLHADGSSISKPLRIRLMRIFAMHIKTYNFFLRRKHMYRAKKKARELRAQELLAQRKLPQHPPEPEAYWS
jgi:cysteinyl-tRNA synthetase